MASLVSSSSTSSTNPVVPGSRISEGQQYLDWSIEKGRERVHSKCLVEIQEFGRKFLFTQSERISDSDSDS